tara:strand:- start:38 stop:286 length:249 start_codon:yes stop_codon:yes gene_type:complete
MKISPSPEFLSWFEETNNHLFDGDNCELSTKQYNKEITDYVNDVLQEHMETLEAELGLIDSGLGDDDDAPDSGFVEGEDKSF